MAVTKKNTKTLLTQPVLWCIFFKKTPGQIGSLGPRPFILSFIRGFYFMQQIPYSIQTFFKIVANCSDLLL